MAKKKANMTDNELESVFRDISEKKPKKSKAGKVIAICMAIILLLLAMGAGGYYLYETLRPIAGDIHVAGVYISGMNREDANEALTALVKKYQTEAVIITADDYILELTPQITGASLDAERLVEDALAGKISSGAVDLLPYLSLNDSALDTQLSKLVDSCSSVITDSTYEILGTQPDLSDPDESAEGQKLVIHIGEPGIAISIDRLREVVMDAYSSGDFAIDYPLVVTDPAAPDIQKAYDESYVAPVDAVMDMTTFKVTDHAYGYTFDLDAVKAAVESAEFNTTLEFDFSYITPEVFAEDLSSMLYRDVLGSYTAVSGSKPKTRDINLKLSCQAINGTVLYPGEVFDYNKALGERTPEKGYQKADGYVGNETVQEYGGGICQASSCLYLSALYADMEIVTRKNHGFISSYMPYGMDATVSWGGPHFRFKNNSEYPIRIEAYAKGGTVTVKIIGTDTKDYYVKMEYEVLEKTPYTTVYKEMTADNEDGYKDGDRIVSPYTGYKIKTYRCKYSKETDELISREEEATSTYKKRDKVVCKIVEPEVETTKPTETKPPETTEPQETTTPTETTSPTESTGVPGSGNITEGG